MFEPRFDLFFSGRVMEGSDPSEVRKKIGKLFSANEKTLDKLFSDQPVCVKSGVDQDTASRYRLAFREAGAILEIKQSVTETAPGSDMEGPHRATYTLLPANTGSLIDCAPVINPTVIAENPAIKLSPPGTDIDTSAADTPPQIDTSHLSLNPPNTGTLEDCRVDTKPTPQPDTSKLKLENSEELQRRIDKLA